MAPDHQSVRGRKTVTAIVRAIGIAVGIAFALSGLAFIRLDHMGTASAAPHGLLVTPDGKIARGVLEPTAIMVFNRNGVHEATIHFDAMWGAFKLRLDDSGAIEVATARNGRRLRLSLDGRVLESIEDPAAFDRFSSANTEAAVGPGGSLFTIEDGAVWRTTRDDQRTKIVSRDAVTELPLPLRSTYPGLGLLVGGVVLLATGICWGRPGKGPRRRLDASDSDGTGG